ncbi:MAG TPA: hypothetical protein DCX52_13935 [Massilia sp.]|nr:hypothetical protein [Massilia sp.]
MALHDPITEEQMDEQLVALTREATDSITQALAAGLPKTVQLIDEALGEYMQNDQARAELLRKSAAGRNAFAEVLTDLIWDEALVRAQKELARQERERGTDAGEARVDRAAWNREAA